MQQVHPLDERYHYFPCDAFRMLMEAVEHLGLTYPNQQFQQENLLTADSFVDYAKRRGISLSKGILEKWEEKGVLMPLFHMARRKLEAERGVQKYEPVMMAPFYYKQRHEEGALVFPDSSNFKSWRSYKVDYHEAVTTLYHPIQILHARKLAAFGYVRVSLLGGVSGKLVETLGRESERTIRLMLGILPNEIKVQRLFISVEDRYLPRIRHQFSQYGIPDEDILDKWYDWLKSEDVAVKVSQIGYDVPRIEALYQHLSVQGRGIDPLGDWYPLVRHVRYKKRQKLDGSALLAQDLYDRALVLKYLLEDLGAKDIPDPDDVMDQYKGAWKERFYGKKISYDDRHVLAKILRDFGISTMYSVFLFCEDESNKQAIEIIARSMDIDFEALDIHIESLGSSSFNSSAFRHRLTYIQQESGVIYLLVDDENNARTEIDKLVRSGLLGEGHFRLWPDEFEGANWSDEEIVDHVQRLAEENGTSIQLTVNDLHAYRESKIREGKPVPKVTKAIEALLQNDESKFSISGRKVLLNRMLAETMSERIRKEKETGVYQPKTPIEEEITKILEIAHSQAW